MAAGSGPRLYAVSLRTIVLVSLIYAACALGGAVATGLIIKDGIDASNAQQRQKLFDVQVAGCHRQNARQRSANKNAFDTYKLDTLFVQAIAHPQPNQPKPTKKEQRITDQFRGRLQDTVDSLVWTPVVPSCDTNPTRVELPVSFSIREPSKADLPKPIKLKEKPNRG